MPSLGGLASGMDTESLITQLMALERRPQTRIALQQRQVEIRQTALRDVQSKLRAVRDAAADMRLPGTWADRQSATVADPTRAAARVTGTAGSGSYSVSVLQLARAEQRSYAADTLPASFTVALDAGGSYGVTAGSGEDAVAVAARINADSAAPVYASATTVEGGGRRLVLTSRTSGAAGGFTVGAGLTHVDAAFREGQDAEVKVDTDPTVYTSKTNVLTAAIAGVELTLTGTGTTTVALSAPAVDRDGVVKSVTALVDRYNQALDGLRARLNEEKVVDPRTDSDLLRGLLRGDAGLRNALSGIRLAVGTRDALDLGIGTGKASGAATFSKDAVAGRLTLDEEALRRALDQDPLAARATAERVSAALERVLAPVAAATGSLDKRLEAEAKEIGRLRDAATALTARLGRTEERLRRQFASLETTLSQSQARGQWLSGQIAGLPSAGGP